jgi:hypothetical protein
MKIKDIVIREDDMRIKTVSPDGKTVTVTDPSGNDMQTPAQQIMPDATKPGAFKMAPTDPKTMTPGASVSSTDQTTQEDGQNPLAAQYIAQLTQMMDQATEPWQKAQLAYRKKAVESGQIPRSPQGGAIKVLDPVTWEKTTDPTMIARIIGKDGLSPEYLKKSNMFTRGLDFIGLEEEGDEDTIASGNHDVGGDATDNFIKQVQSQNFNRTSRPSSTTSPLTVPAKLKETDELYKWLTIAGIK